MMRSFCEEFSKKEKKSQIDSKKAKKSQIDFRSWTSIDVQREFSIEGGRMDICAEVRDTTGQLICRVVIENKIDSPVNGVDKEEKLSQLNRYYEWGKEAGTEPLCFIVAPKSRMDEIKSEIRSLDRERRKKEKELNMKLSDKMDEKFVRVDYKQIQEFLKNWNNLPKNDPSVKFFDLFIQAFGDHSHSDQDLYARKFSMAINQIRSADRQKGVGPQ